MPYHTEDISDGQHISAFSGSWQIGRRRPAAKKSIWYIVIEQPEESESDAFSRRLPVISDPAGERK